ncbi:MAG: hypothetical protein GY878_20615 [Fuerstiella sp.]|nr:hypothetical protein [Fuerstiella sp.]
MQQSAVKFSTMILWRAYPALMLIIGATCLPSVRADEGVADTERPSVQLEVMAVRTRLYVLDRFRGQIDLRVRVTNLSGSPLKLRTSQFTCAVDAEPVSFSPRVSDLLKVDGKDLAADASWEGGLAFSVDRAGVRQPQISLQWSSGEDTVETALVPVTTSVNEAVRRHTNVHSKGIGPNSRVAVVEIHRQFDCLSIEPLTDEFRRLRQQGVRRVVLDIQSDDGITAAYTPADGWLMSVRVGGERSSFPFRPQVRSAVQFDEFYVVRPQAARGSTSRITLPGLFYKSRDEAVTAALRSIYEHIPLKEALKDLTHLETGVRRAVLEASIDRLAADELRSLIDRSRQHGEEELARVAENLHRVALPEVLTHLNDLVRDDRVKVSTAALRSFVRSVSPGARDAMREFWNEVKDAPLLRQRVIEELMNVQDCRYPDLMAEYTEYRLMAFSAATRAVGVDIATGSTPTSVPGRMVTSADVRIMKELLDLMSAQKNFSFVHIAQRELLNITEPVIQDLVIEFVLASGQPFDAELVRQYILHRLPVPASNGGLTEEQQAKLVQRYGPPSAAVKSRYTRTLMTTIRRYLDSVYTERLLELSRSKAVTGTMRVDAFRTAVVCATGDQLSAIVERLDSLDDRQKTHLLKQFSVLNDARWLGLAQHTLMSDQSATAEMIDLLENEGSPESVQVLIDCMQEIRVSSEAAGVVDSQNLKIARQLIKSLAASSYPAARRSFNRCVTSPLEQFIELNQMALVAAFRTEPDKEQRARVVAVSNLKREGKYSEALEKLNSILMASPWYSNGYVSRASLNLRTGSPHLAMVDLKEADRLSPEDPVIRSLIALTEVRLGRTDAGIDMAENVLKSVPDLTTFVRKWTLYNTACVYGRAVEVEDAGDRKDELTRRAMELLLASAKREDGIDDVHHILNDPDLTIFHPHSDWAVFVEIVTENQQKKSKAKS